MRQQLDDAEGSVGTYVTAERILHRKENYDAFFLFCPGRNLALALQAREVGLVFLSSENGLANHSILLPGLPFHLHAFDTMRA